MKYIRPGFRIALLFIPLLLSIKSWGASYISFSSNRTGNHDIYVIDINGENLRNLTNHPSEDLRPTWAPDGRAFAFMSDREGNYEIYIMKLNETEPQRLTNNPETDTDPAWSPDGKWIVFSSRLPREGGYDIYKIDVNGKNLQPITDDRESDRSATWSPDGEQIAFSSRRNGGGIHLMNADGTRIRRIINTGASPSWSPDGKQLAYDTNIQGNGIYIMDAEGQNSRRVSPINVWSYNPAWSPDSGWIAYGSEIENPWGNPNRDRNIYIVSVDGGEPRKITKYVGEDDDPKWVPDGFLSIYPSAKKQTTLWGKLKQSVRD